MIFSCSNASMQSIYFNKKKKLTVKRAFQKLFILTTHPPQLPCSAVEPQKTVKGVALKSSLYLGRCNVDWESEHFSPLSPIPEQSRAPAVGMALPGMASGPASGSLLLIYTIDMFNYSLPQPADGNEP